MNLRACVCYLLLGLLACGCRNNGQYDHMQRELRLQEDRIYELEGYIEQYQMMLEEQESGEPVLEGTSGRSRTLDSSEPASPRQPPEDLNLELPEVDLGTPGSIDSTLEEPSLPEGLTDPLPSSSHINEPLLLPSAKRRWERKRWLKTARRNPAKSVAPPWKPDQQPAANPQLAKELWQKKKAQAAVRPEPNKAKEPTPAGAHALRPRWQPYR